MKILQVTEAIAPVGGCERIVLDTCALLLDLGHDVQVAVADDTPREAAPVPVHGIPRSWGPFSVRRMGAEIEARIDRIRPDILHLHNIRSFLSPFLLGSLQRKFPTIRYVHDARLFCPRNPSKRLARSGALCPYPMGVRCLLHCFPVHDTQDCYLGPVEFGVRYAELAATRRLDAVLVGSEYMYRQLVLNGFRPDRLRLLPGFTDMAPQPVSPSCAPHILAIGRFDGSKGLENLPDILARLHAPDWSATVVGDGSGLESTRARAAELGIESRIHFQGRVARNQLDELYRNAAVLVVPSLSVEAFGLVGIEAMAFARPVVAYDLGGMKEWLDHGRTGYLVSPGDVSGLAAQLDSLLANPVLRQVMGQVARQTIEKRFRPRHYAQGLLDVYVETLKRHRQSNSVPRT